MSSITVSAKTVNDAITEASIQLGIASTGIEYEVIEEGSAGFLGIGKKQAVIKAWKKSDFGRGRCYRLQAPQGDRRFRANFRPRGQRCGIR